MEPMPEPERAVWLRVANGVNSLSEAGARVWLEPAQTRKALGELLGVFPATHVQIDLSALAYAGDADGGWGALLSRVGRWPDLLKELALALGSAMRAPAVWGLGLPSPGALAPILGDASERGVLKAGLQLASFLQVFREAQIGFVAVDVSDPPNPGEPRALAPIFRNSEMYGWRRAICVADLRAAAATCMGAEIALVQTARIAELCPAWEGGDLVGGGLCGDFWKGGELEKPAPRRFLLYGAIPEGTPPRALVQAGRMLRAWMG
jgi:hypothetical protein